MRLKSRNTRRKQKLMDFQIMVKPTKLIYSTKNVKDAGEIIIRSRKLRSAVGKKVRVIVKTNYTL